MVEKQWLNIRIVELGCCNSMFLSKLDHGVSFAMGNFALTSFFLLTSAFFVMTSSKISQKLKILSTAYRMKVVDPSLDIGVIRKMRTRRNCTPIYWLYSIFWANISKMMSYMWCHHVGFFHQTFRKFFFLLLQCGHYYLEKPWKAWNIIRDIYNTLDN